MAFILGSGSPRRLELLQQLASRSGGLGQGQEVAAEGRQAQLAREILHAFVEGFGGTHDGTFEGVKKRFWAADNWASAWSLMAAEVGADAGAGDGQSEQGFDQHRSRRGDERSTDDSRGIYRWSRS